MKVHMRLLILLFLFAGCAAYKELEPVPPISPIERGYVELKSKNENFQLAKGKKYFMKFPGPSADHFYLILTTSAKPVLIQTMSGTFDGSHESVVAISDETKSSRDMSVYEVDTKSAMFYWVIEDVKLDTTLLLKYRYVPEWRYKFENKYAEFQKTLSQNVIDRTTYNSIGPKSDVDGLDLNQQIDLVQQKDTKLNMMKAELQQFQSIFPKNITTSKDTAYARYVSFKKIVDEEVAFHENYLLMLNFLMREREVRNETEKFLDAIPYFTGIVSQSSRFPAPFMSKATSLMLNNLGQITPYLEKVLRGKNDAGKFGALPSLDDMSSLYRECGQQTPLEIQGMFQFVSRYNDEVDSLNTAKAKFTDLQSYYSANVASLTPLFFADLTSKTSEIKSALPDPEIGGFVQYANFKCGKLLTDDIMTTAKHADDLGKVYGAAGSVISQLSSHAFSPAETNLRALFSMKATSNFAEISEQRIAFTKKFETELFNTIKSESEQRIESFVNTHSTVVDNIPQLYTDSAFYPVYQLTFSSLGANDVVKKRKQIEEYLTQIKYYRFPETAIRSLYEEFTRNARDRGVEKARAIVDHGKIYRGADKQVKGLVSECDVQVAKLITKPKEYRKLFALPVTSNPSGENNYMFRVQLQIQSDAEFPVFDVNIKLPQEISLNAVQEQWYESIAIDKKEIKNEGRFRITSPTSENDYEAQITPVQMDKQGKNILEIHFKYSGFQVFEVSAMAQVPIIRKN